ncbi:aminomethyl-transferring glycine dehydrogenase subunit GcvPA [Heminiphilus faecis]|uniref:aminomethyl-transferring glycine dehydrogenase subunit GcvPA n=1 Tax=Heminiphilus faecis TaxID=2601703 RepID=UPI001245354F|nr:aminomethyl-transferring glycine dehydrogenase subunit GcvPA [Heminiphilus faecis]
MSHRYLPHTPDDISEMLVACSMHGLDELYSDVPHSLLLGREYYLPSEKSEKEVRDFFKKLGEKNRPMTCFAGAGWYDRYTPAVIPALLSRSEFLTAYTPYQPEISQGTLQYIFEYQSMMALLTGLDVSNASMYDGATAVAEAMMMTVAASRKRNRVLVSATVLPQVREVMATYARYHGIILDTLAEEEGVTSRADFEEKMASGDVAGVVVASPNRYGVLENYSGWADTVHAAKALFVMTCEAAAIGAVKSPGEWGADIAAGDAQSLGMPLNFGGPYLGYICCTRQLIRKLPGRIVGATVDEAGRRVFVLTLQAREQHIRREKATSNICSNQGLMALFVSVYMSLLGPQGLKELNSISCAGAHYLAERIVNGGKARLSYPDKPFLHEFELTTSFDVDALMQRAMKQGILPGVRLADNRLLVAVTEMQSRDDLDCLADIIDSMPSTL